MGGLGLVPSMVRAVPSMVEVVPSMGGVGLGRREAGLRGWEGEGSGAVQR